MHARGRMSVDSRIPTLPGRSTSGFGRPGRHFLLAPSAAIGAGTFERSMFCVAARLSWGSTQPDCSPTFALQTYLQSHLCFTNLFAVPAVFCKHIYSSVCALQAYLQSQLCFTAAANIWSLCRYATASNLECSAGSAIPFWLSHQSYNNFVETRPSCTYGIFGPDRILNYDSVVL